MPQNTNASLEIYSLGKAAQLRETPKVKTTTSALETEWSTQGNDLGHSNNVLDWTIRSELLRVLHT